MPPMVGERSPKPLMWVRFLPSVLTQELRLGKHMRHSFQFDFSLGWSRVAARNKVNIDNKKIYYIYEVRRKCKRIVQRAGSQDKLAKPQGIGAEFGDSIDRFHNTSADSMVDGLVL